MRDMGRKGLLFAALGAVGGLLTAGVLSVWNVPADPGAGAALWYLLFAALGATVGVAALPFADDGASLVVRSLAHFGATALELLLILRLCFQVKEPAHWLGWLGILAMLYLLVWLGRYVGWCWEVADLRRRLGLPQGASPLKWRETLPYLPVLLLSCVLVPLLARWADRTWSVDVPVLSGLLVPLLFQPVTGVCSGFALGRRQGFCPLYPLAGAALYLPVLLWAYNHTAAVHCLAFALPALLGMGLGALRRRSSGSEQKSRG